MLLVSNIFGPFFQKKIICFTKLLEEIDTEQYLGQHFKIRSQSFITIEYSKKILFYEMNLKDII